MKLFHYHSQSKLFGFLLNELVRVFHNYHVTITSEFNYMSLINHHVLLRTNLLIPVKTKKNTETHVKNGLQH